MNERSVSRLDYPGATKVDRPGPRVALVGTYPPTRCGIAFFTASLRTALLEAGSPRVDIVRVMESGDSTSPGAEVVLEFRPDDPADVRQAATVLSAYDTVVLQHEFGIYGPRSGWAAVDLIEAVTAPVVVTLHTVTDDPSDRQRRIVEAVTATAAVTVVLSDTAGRLLVSRYGADPSQVQVIPHGAEPLEGEADLPGGIDLVGPMLLTWGLIGPGKGLDWAVAALPLVKQEVPDAHWVIAGQTHPKVAAREGERYRRSLQETITSLGLERSVTLLDEYLTRGQIHRLIQRASAVVLPYDSTQQTSSGVLMEAVAAGVPVVATAFPQAVEVAAKGGARVVAHRDVEALADAAVGLLSDPVAAVRMVGNQRSMAPDADWSEVGVRYLGLVEDLVTAIAS